ncbi:MAG: MotA/TolQ/ExbB proton channel family protein [Opitutales bacterium]
MRFLNLEFLLQGGFLIWPLLLLSLVGFVIFLERTLFLHRGQIRSQAFVDGIKSLTRKGRLNEALTLCEETPGPVAYVTKAALLHHDDAEDRMRSAIQAAALVEIPILERRVGTLGAIATVAPLIGLLGTVVAIFGAFQQLHDSEAYAATAAFSGQAAQALITTAAGLAIAVMAHLAQHFLSGRVRALVHDMEWVGNDMMQFLQRDLPEALEAAAQQAEETLEESGDPPVPTRTDSGAPVTLPFSPAVASGGRPKR